MADQGAAGELRASDNFDATNCVRLCERCEGESGVGAGADAGDRACSVCGRDDAPHIYPCLGVAFNSDAAFTALREAVLRVMAGEHPGRTWREALDDALNEATRAGVGHGR